MRPFVCLYLTLFLLLVVVLLPVSHAGPATQGTCKSIDDVEETCRAVVAKSRSVINYDFCIRSLKSDHSARSADLHGLAVAAAGLAIAHAESTESKIEELMDLETDDTVRGGFGACLERYSDAADRLRDALDNMNARLYPQAMGLLEASLDAHDHCERVLGGGSVSPLAMQDRDYGKLAGIAMAIAGTVE